MLGWWSYQQCYLISIELDYTNQILKDLKRTELKMESEDYNEVLARKLLLEALEAFDSGQYDYAKVLAEKSLSLDKNSIDGNW